MSISTVPVSWPTVPVKAVGTVMTGQQKRAFDGTDGLYSYLRVANVQDGYIDASDVQRMPFSVKNRERLGLETGDILLCEGQSLELVGRAAMYRGDPKEAYFQNTLVRFRPGPSVDAEFALLVFRAYQYSGVFQSIARSTTNLAHLGAKRFAELPFPVPAIEEQRRIAILVGAVEQQLAAAAASVAETARLLTQLLPRVRDSVIQRENSVSPATEKLSDLADPLAPITYGVLKPGPNQPAETGVPLIRGADLQDGFVRVENLNYTTRKIADDYARSVVTGGDILLGIIRHTRVAKVPDELGGAQITQGTARIRPGQSVDRDYLYHFLSSRTAQEWLAQRLRGIDMPGLNLRDVRDLPVPYRSLSEQWELGRKLNEIEAEVRIAQVATHQSGGDLEAVRRKFIVGATYGPESLEIREISAQVLDFARSITSNVPASVASNSDSINLESNELHQRGAMRVMTTPGVPYKLTTQSMLSAIVASGGSSTPEELFELMALKPADADAFFVVLRALVHDNSIRIRRPDARGVEIVAA